MRGVVQPEVLPRPTRTRCERRRGERQRKNRDKNDC
jgi:hypothetical protein